MQPTNFQFQPLAYDVQIPADEAIEAGVEAAGLVTIVAGTPLPIADPTSGQQMIIPLAQIQFPLDKEHLTKLGELMLERAAELPDPKPQSDIVLASHMGEAAQAAQALRGFDSRNK